MKAAAEGNPPRLSSCAEGGSNDVKRDRATPGQSGTRRLELLRRDLPPGARSGSTRPPSDHRFFARGQTGMDRTSQRRERVRRALKTDRVDALLVVSVSNVTYLTGFTGDSSALLLTRDRALVISDGRF